MDVCSDIKHPIINPMHLQPIYGTLEFPRGWDVHQPEHSIVAGSRISVVLEPITFLQPAELPAFKLFCDQSICLGWAEFSNYLP